MSQAGSLDNAGSDPQIPTMFVTNSGTAIPIGNTLEILAIAVPPHNIPVETTGSGNTVTVVAQCASAVASTSKTAPGLASFNSSQFTVDANGFVSSTGGGGGTTSFTVDGFTPPGTNPVVPNGSNVVTVTGGQVAAGTTVNVIRTESLAANTYTIQIQRSQAVASSTVGDNGVSHFNSSHFTVDSNGFVSASGSGLGQTITGDNGLALPPTAGNWNILGAFTASGATPVQTSGTGSTMTVEVQTSQAIPVTDANNIGLCAFDDKLFTVDSNGFVSANGTGLGQTITGNTGGPLSPTAGNWDILGTGNITTSGSGSTLTTDLTGIIQHAVQVGGATNTLTQVSPSTLGFVLTDNGATADPSFQANPGTIAFKTINIVVFNYTGSTQTYTPTSGMAFCFIEAQGGGGGGGGVSGVAATIQSVGGGSAGCYVKALFDAATIGASQVVTIGAGGAGGGAPTAGGNGGTTTVGSLISAGGGTGNVSTTGAPTFYEGALGSSTGVATGYIGAPIVIPGGSSNGAVTLAAFGTASPAGSGGSSYFGAGGLGVASGSNAGTGYGSGGSGAANNGGGAVGGGAGAPGVVVITEYII